MKKTESYRGEITYQVTHLERSNKTRAWIPEPCPYPQFVTQVLDGAQAIRLSLAFFFPQKFVKKETHNFFFHDS